MSVPKPLLAALLPLILGAGILASPPAGAQQLTTMVAIDPSASDRGISAVSGDLTASLGKALKSPIRVDRSTNFADVLRSTRTGEYDIYIVPVQVGASGLTHGYTVVADSRKEETFVLVSVASIASVDKLKGKRLYLPQQD